MKKIIRSLLFVAFLSLTLAPEARSEDKYLSGLDDIYWNMEGVPPRDMFDMGGEDVSYDNDLGALVPMKGDVPPPVWKPMIAVVVDDMGVDRRQSERAVRTLNPSVTLSYLPYSPHVQEQADAAMALGHEIILHLPLEPDRGTVNPGPNHLSIGMTKEQMQKHLLANLDGFRGYVGVNNHMGSRFSRDRPGVGIVMEEIRKRGVFFLDSRTTRHTILRKAAQEHGISATYRDVFLDHVEKPEFVAAALDKVENIARLKGSAVAIGHPKDMTLEALEAWLPEVETRGFQLVPLSEVLKYRQSKSAVADTALPEANTTEK
ncbi:MAG: divergent polysaccharide deacetylase family protein [Pseudomonadota bacterium]